VYVAVDYETHLMDEQSGLAPRPVCLSYYDGKTEGLVVGLKEIEEYLHHMLDTYDTMIAHNVMFEMCVTYEHFLSVREKLKKAIKDQRFICTKLYEQHINAGFRANKSFMTSYGKVLGKVNLAALVEHYYHVDISEAKTDPNAWRLRYSELDGVPRSNWPIEAVNYAIMDSVWAYRIYQKQMIRQLKSVKEAVECEIWLNLAANKGMNIDTSRVKQLEQEVLDAIAPARQFLIDSGICYYDKNGEFCKKDKELREHIEEIVAVPRKTGKGNIIIRSEMLEEYAGQTQDKILLNYMQVKKLEKVLTTYLSRMTQDTVRTQYSAGKETNRTSTSVRAPFLLLGVQQMPRQMNE
jgi:hypothetical protein